MTLLDAPKFDAARDRRNTMILRISAAALLVLFVVLVAGGRPARGLAVELEPLLFGRITREPIHDGTRSNDLPRPTASGSTTRTGSSIRSSTALILSADSRAIGARPARTTNTARFTATRLRSLGTTATACSAAILINGRKSNALDLAYDPKTGQLSFAPPGVSCTWGRKQTASSHRLSVAFGELSALCFDPRADRGRSR